MGHYQQHSLSQPVPSSVVEGESDALTIVAAIMGQMGSDSTQNNLPTTSLRVTRNRAASRSRTTSARLKK